MIGAWKAWGPAVLWAAVLFLLSEVSGVPRGLDVPYLDKVAHFFLYGVLGAALGWGQRVSPAAIPHWVLVAVGIAYGAIDEWHQSFVPGRSPDPWDFLVDLAGVTFGYVVLLLSMRNVNRQREGGPRP